MGAGRTDRHAHAPRKSSGPRYSIIPAAAVYDGRVKPSALRILGALGVYADNEGWCFPQQSTIADDLGYNRARVSEAIVCLAKLGYVACELRVEKGRGLRGLWYRVVLDTPGRRDAGELDTRGGAGVRKTEHREGAEQNGETGPVFAKPNTGAGVRSTATPVFAKPNTGYIDERSQENEAPIVPASGDGLKTKTQKPKAGDRRAAKAQRDPPGFTEAWAMWPKPGSSKKRALKAWREHRATGAEKLAAVKAYLGSQQARAKDGLYVAYFQNWLTNSLGSFVERVQRSQARSLGQKRGRGDAPDVSAVFPAWSAALEALRRHDPAVFESYWRPCRPITDTPLRVVAGSILGFERLTREHAPRAERVLGLKIVILDPREVRADCAVLS